MNNSKNIKPSLGLQTGGHITDVPEPWEMRFGVNSNEKRRIIVTSRVYGLNALGNGHHHVSITEEDNYVWNKNTGYWWRPWQPDIDKDFDNYLKYKATFTGRNSWNSDYTRATDVIKWVKSILKEWDINESTHIVEWDLDDDDPNIDILEKRQIIITEDSKQ